MNATCTTSSGVAQCARMRGRPFAMVNGDFGISILSSRARKSSSIFVSKPVPTLPAKTGVERILAQLPEAQLLLTHIEWRRGLLRANVSINYKLVDAKDYKDAQAILDAVYSLPV